MERNTFSEDNSVPFRIRSSLLSNSMLLYERLRPRRRKERNYFLFADKPTGIGRSVAFIGTDLQTDGTLTSRCMFWRGSAGKLKAWLCFPMMSSLATCD